MGRRATLKEVAAELGVSLATVSNAYNRPDQLSAALRERVFETARRLGYPGPDAMARGLRRGRAGAVGVLYEDRLSYAFADPAAVLFLRGVSVATEEAKLGLLLLSGAPGEARGPEAVSGAVVDGFVVNSLSEGDPLVASALERRLPVVVVDQPRIGSLAFVGIDDEGAARSVAEHLVGLGHRRFGVVTFGLGPKRPEGDGIASIERQEAATYPVSRNRLRGFAAALEAAGVAWEDVPIYENYENVPEGGKRATEFLLSQEPRPTAILAISDQLAFGAIEAAKEMGLSVPEDLSVAGFDDVPEAAAATPPLTTIRQPHQRKGSEAVRLLLEGPEAQSVLLPIELVVRASTAPAP